MLSTRQASKSCLQLLILAGHADNCQTCRKNVALCSLPSRYGLAQLTALCFRPDCIQQVSYIQTAQELIDSAKSQLIGNCKALESLEHKSGHLLPKNTDTFQAFTAAVAEWDSSLGLPQQIGELAFRILHGIHIMQQVSRARTSTTTYAWWYAGTQQTNLNQALLNSVLEVT